jgi:hypothetical protein
MRPAIDQDQSYLFDVPIRKSDLSARTANELVPRLLVHQLGPLKDQMHTQLDHLWRS